MNYTELFKEELTPLMRKYGFVYRNGVFFKAVGDIMMAVSCSEDSLDEVRCAVFPVWEADEILGVSEKYTDLSADIGWADEFRLSNRPIFSDSLSARIDGMEITPADCDPTDFRLARLRLGIFVLPDLAEVKDFVSYTEWRSGEYKMTSKDFTPHEMVMRSHIDGNFEYAERYLFRLSRNSAESEDELRQRFAPFYESMESGDTAWIEGYAEDKRKKFLPYFLSAFPEAFCG